MRSTRLNSPSGVLLYLPYDSLQALTAGQQNHLVLCAGSLNMPGPVSDITGRTHPVQPIVKKNVPNVKKNMGISWENFLSFGAKCPNLLFGVRSSSR